MDTTSTSDEDISKVLNKLLIKESVLPKDNTFSHLHCQCGVDRKRKLQRVVQEDQKHTNIQRLGEWHL
jgi:hypothetical protein